MPLKESNSSSASFRKHFLRTLQYRLQSRIPDIIADLNNRNFFPGTEIQKALAREESLKPDHITMSQLEMITQICKTFEQKGLYSHFVRNYIIANLLDVADGPLARQLNLASPEGAMKDAIVDRIAEKSLATIIAHERSKYDKPPDNLERELNTAFQLSTLTKAACEMCGVETKEGGIGSMMQRRTILLVNLYFLGELRKIPKNNNVLRNGLINVIDTLNSYLINSSRDGADRRINLIAEKGQTAWENKTLDNPDSSAAGEARKYVMVILMNERLNNNIVGALNDLAKGKIKFPSMEHFIERYPYVTKSIVDISDFFNNALSIAGLNNEPI